MLKCTGAVGAVIAILTAAAFALVILGIVGYRKKKRAMLVSSVIALAVIVLTVGAVTLTPLRNQFFMSRDYCDDLRIVLEENEGTLIIKEWTFLTSGGAEIYYEKAGDAVKLGDTTVSGGTFTPFNDGKYELAEAEGEIMLSWYLGTSKDASGTKSASFKLTD